MSCTDPIADAITIIRNGIMVSKETVSFKHSKIKEGLCQVLLDEGYITRVDVLDTKPARTIKVGLKYDTDGNPVIHAIKRISTPGRRSYGGKAELQPVLNGFGIAVLSTNKGILSDRVCREMNIGGEVLCEVQ